MGLKVVMLINVYISRIVGTVEIVSEFFRNFFSVIKIKSY